MAKLGLMIVGDGGRRAAAVRVNGLRKSSALALAAKYRPVGCVDISKEPTSRSLVERNRRSNEALGRLLLAREQTDDYVSTLDDYITNILLPVNERNSKWCRPHVVVYMPATRTLRYVKIVSVNKELYRMPSGAPRLYVTTEDGEMLLPQTTNVVWL